MSKHIDDIAVAGFAGMMQAKMAKCRKEGKNGWDNPARLSDDQLRAMLREAVIKGDPVDVANFCMMLFHRGEPTTKMGELT